MDSHKNSKLDDIQRLRGIASILVVINHVGYYFAKNSPDNSWLHDTGLLNLGGFGVDIFFCISGFIMVLTTTNGESGALGASVFLRKRLARIYPTYWAWTLITIALPFLLYFKTDLLSGYSSTYLASNILLIPIEREGNGVFSPIIGQGWTLQFEMFFYVAFAMGIYLTGAKKAPLFASYSILSLFILSILEDLPSEIEYIVGNEVILNFATGIAAGAIYLSCRNREVNQRALLIGMAAAAVYAIYAVQKPPFDSRFLTFGLPAFIIVFLSAFRSSKKSSKRSLTIFLGEASYTIYLCHMVFVWIALKYSSALPRLDIDLVIIMVSMAITAASCIMYLVIEKPLTRASYKTIVYKWDKRRKEVSTK